MPLAETYSPTTGCRAAQVCTIVYTATIVHLACGVGVFCGGAHSIHGHPPCFMHECGYMRVSSYSSPRHAVRNVDQALSSYQISFTRAVRNLRVCVALKLA